MAYQEINKTIL